MTIATEHRIPLGGGVIAFTLCYRGWGKYGHIPRWFLYAEV